MKALIALVFAAAALFTVNAFAEGFTCEIKHGAYSCYRNSAECEKSATIDIQESQALVIIQLVPVDGREIMLLEELDPMRIIKATDKRFKANQVEVEDGPVILGEIDLAKKGSTWNGTLYTDGVQFDLVCKLAR